MCQMLYLPFLKFVALVHNHFDRCPWKAKSCLLVTQSQVAYELEAAQPKSFIAQICFYNFSLYLSHCSIWGLRAGSVGVNLLVGYWLTPTWEIKQELQCWFLEVWTSEKLEAAKMHLHFSSFLFIILSLHVLWWCHCLISKHLLIIPLLAHTKTDRERKTFFFFLYERGYFGRGNVSVPLQISTYPATALLDEYVSLHHFTWLSACRKEIKLSGPALRGEPQPLDRKTDSRKKLIKLLLTSLETVTQTMILD